ncbi:hypothetical protein ABPG72_000577 [Tetrahymena utriculariae]
MRNSDTPSAKRSNCLQLKQNLNRKNAELKDSQLQSCLQPSQTKLPSSTLGRDTHQQIAMKSLNNQKGHLTQPQKKSKTPNSIEKGMQVLEPTKMHYKQMLILKLQHGTHAL